MCATCGCLTSNAPAPEDGTYKCLECDQAAKPQKVTVQKGDAMPKCTSCGSDRGHWVNM